MLIKKYNYNSFLEIGVERGDTFLNIECPIKVGIDPDLESKATEFITSDEFFKKNKDTFDIIFIDGLHEHHQVVRDIENSLNILNPDGIIIVHDCNPNNSYQARLLEKGYEKDGTVWCGSTWAGWVELRTRREDLEMVVIPDEWGIGFIKRGKQKLVEFDFNISYEQQFENWKRDKLKLSNFIDASQFMKRFIY